MKTAIILSNLGTPESPSSKSVGKYLREFLSDPDVINLPWILRFLLVNLIIVPLRAPKSAKKYAKIWSKDGSPLLVHSQLLLEKVAEKIKAPIFLGMRYGKPSLEKALEDAISLGTEKIVLYPLYPQYASATSGSTEKKFKELCEEKKFKGEIVFAPPFPTADFFINAQVQLIKEKRGNEHLLISFHGLPESQVKKMGPNCLQTEHCCEQLSAANANCYRAQCFATARAIAGKLGLEKSEWSVSFQSRLGRAKWITPYTEDTLKELAQKGIKSVALAAPSFVADCLETLEELGIESRKSFMDTGGNKFTLISCVNSDERFIEGLSEELNKYLLRK